MIRNNIHRPYPDGRFFFGAPFVGGLLGGLVGSAIFRPRPFYGYPPYPYGGYPYGYGYGYGYGNQYGGGYPY
jgi:hypothetical protein